MSKIKILISAICASLVLSFSPVNIAKGPKHEIQASTAKINVARLGRFRLSAPIRIPRTPPRIRAPIVRSPALVQRQITRNIRALKVAPATCRTQLRKALTTGNKMVKMGRKFHAHHILPVAKRSHPVFLRAGRGGFNFNSAQNGIRIPVDTHKKVHSALVNKSNNQTIAKFLDKLHSKGKHFSDKQIANLMQRQVRKWKYEIIGQKPLLKQFNNEVVPSGRK